MLEVSDSLVEHLFNFFFQAFSYIGHCPILHILLETPLKCIIPFFFDHWLTVLSHDSSEEPFHMIFIHDGVKFFVEKLFAQTFTFKPFSVSFWGHDILQM